MISVQKRAASKAKGGREHLWMHTEMDRGQCVGGAETDGSRFWGRTSKRGSMRDGEMLKALAVHSGEPESRSPAPTTGVHTCDSSSRMDAGEGRSYSLPV